MKYLMLLFVLAGIFITGCRKENSPTEEIVIPPLTTWIYRDSSYLILSGIAKHHRSDQGIPEHGFEVLLTDQNITCSNSQINSGATIKITFSDFSTKKYTAGEYEISFQIGGEYFNASIESNRQAGLTLVDTSTTNKIQGWIALKRQNIPAVDVYGTFDVPFCPTN